MKKKIVWGIVFVLYIAVLLRLTVFRLGFSFDNLYSGSLNLIPFQQYIKFAKNGSWVSFIYYFAGNLLAFIPFGYLLTEVTNWDWKYVGEVSAVFSFLIEIAQFVFGSGVSEIDDVLLNTAGAMIGYFVAKLVNRDSVDSE